jgi:hypothetical protein
MVYHDHQGGVTLNKNPKYHVRLKYTTIKLYERSHGHKESLVKVVKQLFWIVAKSLENDM